MTLSNWRGIYGPPDMPDYAVDYWQDAIERAVKSDSWAKAAEKNQWVTTFMEGDEFDNYLEETNQQVTDAFKTIGQQ